MLSRTIELSLQHRFAVLLSVLLLIAVGGYSLSQLDIDAFPDTTPIMVQVNTTAASLASGGDRTSDHVSRSNNHSAVFRHWKTFARSPSSAFHKSW